MTKQRQIVAIGTAFYLVLAVGCQTTEPEQTRPLIQKIAPKLTLEAAAVHPMVMIGRGPLFLSHMPMFQKPRDYQAVLEVDLYKPGVDALQEYTEDRRVTGEPLYTLVPEPLAISELLGAQGGMPQRVSFRAVLYRGHPASGGQVFLKDVAVKVKRVVFAKKLKKAAAPLTALQYFVFGSEQGLFAAHVINQAPDFDQITAIRVPEGIMDPVQATALRKGALVEISGAANTREQALKAGEEKEAVVGTGRKAQTISINALPDFSYQETEGLQGD